ncbi:hypothetical protein [Secundilactobacillus silagei]|mgnify:FL=1|uniref:Extracellular protein n=2 Tax=Secundilactobacillus silagei TaxID=1293415 RepID=A0A1Z5IFC5_9LACO|nr:hypothetical protein [Secundilactobacillus silagei]TDG72102.1 hypothetical protein C5L25_002486 [Secundilactobacillus silagei JCM 19001]GAX00460.1 hypothetical protein IWT126_00475 [Secundilactobacillus silagei JCM 19001]
MKKLMLAAGVLVAGLSLSGVGANAKSAGTASKSVRGTWYSTTAHYRGEKAGEMVSFSTHKLTWHSFPSGTGNFGYLPTVSKVHGWYRINVGQMAKMAQNKHQAVAGSGWTKADYMYFRHVTHKVNGKTQSVLLWNVTGSKLKSAQVFTHAKTLLPKGQRTVSVSSSGSYKF